ENKLRGNADAYLTEDLKIIYVAGRVSGDALALILPRLRATNQHAYETINELYEHLEELYGDLNKEHNACQAFKDLTMKKEQTFQEFYSTFLRCVADGNISPRDLKDDLNDKLTWKLQETVAMYYNDPTVTLSQLERRDRTARKPDGACKATPEQTLARRTDKTTESEQAPQPTRRARSVQLPKTQDRKDEADSGGQTRRGLDLRIARTRVGKRTGHVSGDALVLISPRLSAANHHIYETVNELYEYLYELYSDPNKERNIHQAFKDLTMKKGQSFQEFYMAFLRYVADGNISP
ncbi:hypothetical protein GP486_008142, partial [Trichoglossum hirsutum]